MKIQMTKRIISSSVLLLATILITIQSESNVKIDNSLKRSNRFSDDRELSAGNGKRFYSVRDTLVPDSIQKVGDHSGLFLQFVRVVKNQPVGVSGLKVQLPATFRIGNQVRTQTVQMITDIYGRLELPSCSSESVKIQAHFSDPRYVILNSGKPYSLSFQVPCKSKILVSFKEDSAAGQVVSIFQVIQRAIYTLSTVGDLSFWSRKISFRFPADGDYYNNDVVSLTLGQQWDVVAHEMGHAIYDQANIGAFGGGSHKIDECYSAAMALSEGWASFFAAWTHIDLKDSDAKFEYLVPRRAPIRFETVPNDVCGKSTNEWRVTAYFWDLIDLNKDGEISEVIAKKLWDDLLNADARSMKDIADKLAAKGWAKDQLQQVWKLNFPQD